MTRRDDWQQTARDYARAFAFPTTLIMGGGVGEANHWSEWLGHKRSTRPPIKPSARRRYGR